MKNVFKINIALISCLLVAELLTGCNKKDDYLDAVPNNHLAIPRTLNDLQLLMQDESTFNDSDPEAGVASDDEFYLLTTYYNSLSDGEKKEYTWDKNFQTSSILGGNYPWLNSYTQIYNANVVLDALTNMKASSEQQGEYNQIKGTALFFRAKAFFNLMQIYSLPYSEASASTNLGIPLRLSSDINLKVPRSTQKACYAQIIGDLKTADELLPATTAKFTEPNLTTVAGFLARVYLALGDYDNAFKYADDFLSKFNTLTDYNLYYSDGYFSSFPSEVEFQSSMQGMYPTSFRAFIDSSLYASYAPNDLRKSFFFQNGPGYVFLGIYDAQNYDFFNGIATDEIYLTRAECYARQGNTTAAIQDLNTLLKARFLKGTFVPYAASSADDALSQILKERQKELIYRGLRWSDLKRLNQDPRFAKTLTRNINGTIYTLPPNDPRYALPIPEEEIQLNPMPQNQR